jgi:hypothetical protein
MKPHSNHKSAPNKRMQSAADSTLMRGVGWQGKMRCVLFLVAIVSLVGCAESNFELASESRLPKWFTLAEGLDRDDVKVTLSYYFKPSGRYAVFEIESKDKSYREKAKGKQRGPYSINIEGSQYSFEVFTIDGITEVIEHRKTDPIFYISENSAAIEQLTSD